MPGELVVSILGNVGIAAEVFESVPEGMEYDIVREAQFLVDVPAAGDGVGPAAGFRCFSLGGRPAGSGWRGFYRAGNWTGTGSGSAFPEPSVGAVRSPTANIPANPAS